MWQLKSALHILALTSLSAFLTSSPTHVLAQRPPAKRNHDTHNYYVVEHNPDAGIPLNEVEKRLGVEVVEQVGELEGVWLVRAPKAVVSRRDFDDDLDERELLDDIELEARDLEEEALKRRDEAGDQVLQAWKALRTNVRQRDSNQLSTRSELSSSDHKLASSIVHLEKQHLRHLEKRAPPPIKPPPGTSAVKQKFGIEDQYFTLQWHLANDRYPEHMMNVTPVWEMGYTGKGVTAGLIDDGLDHTSEDLRDNFDPVNSYDFNDHESLPYPKRPNQHHGTRCAGQIAAVKNKACAIGIAHEAKVAGLRILGGRITTVDEAAALNYGYQNISIYSCSWGPRDDGTKMQAPPYIVRKAVLNGINKGRGGKGSVFVFASGNGAHKGDQCNFDGYTNSIYSVTVGAVDYKGLHPKYSEPCAANMVVAYSSGSGEHIVTTDRGNNECAFTHGGTSAAAPNVAGVFTLALQARPDLTWRDIQYLCLETARRINPKDRDWERTASGRYYSYKYGYGVLDASLYIQRALTWQLVKPQAWLETPTIQLDGGTMDEEEEFDGGRFIGKDGVQSKIAITEGMMAGANLESLEHVTVKVWIDHTRRGDVRVELVSPNGIKSVLAAPRERDESTAGFPAWTFMSVKHWGENPVGEWTINVSDQQTEAEAGAFLGWSMILWGTTIDASKAKLYEIDASNEKLLPPNRTGTITPVRPGLPGHDEEATKTKTKGASKTIAPGHGVEGKPTEGLPHDPSGGEPTLGSGGNGKGWVGNLKDKAAQQTWLAGVVGFLILVNVGVGVWFCCVRKRRGDGYAALSGGGDGGNGGGGGESMSMSRLGGYQDAEHEGERTALVGRDEDEVGGEGGQGQGQGQMKGPHAQARSTGGIGFHSGFLDDDDPLSAKTPRYRDGGVMESVPPSAVGELVEAGTKGKERESSSEEENGSEESSEEEEEGRKGKDKESVSLI